MKIKPNGAPKAIICTLTECVSSSTLRANEDRILSSTAGKEDDRAPYYKETYLGICRTFRLHGSKLCVERTVRGRTFGEEFDLAQVAPGSTRLKIMNVAALNRSITYLGVILVVAVIARAVIHVPALWVAIGAAIFSLPALHVILYFMQSMDVEQFKDANGRVLFDFIHTKKQARELEEFLFGLRAALEKNEPKAPGP
jgi:hypothetical protein